jgi:hypothetical protein
MCLRRECHVCYMCGMKKQFAVRARLVCYMEASDIAALTARAREEGKVLVEWARETLLRAIRPAPTFTHAPAANPQVLDTETARNVRELGLQAASTAERPAHHPRCSCRMCSDRAR